MGEEATDQRGFFGRQLRGHRYSITSKAGEIDVWNEHRSHGRPKEFDQSLKLELETHSTH